MGHWASVLPQATTPEGLVQVTGGLVTPQKKIVAEAVGHWTSVLLQAIRAGSTVTISSLT